MIKFSQFINLLEGGNLAFMHPERGLTTADSIQTSNRDTQRPEFHQMFSDIDSAFEKKHGHNLFGNALQNNRFAAGSSDAYFNPEISTERLKKSKSSFGDMDVQIPKEHRGKLNEFLQPGQEFGNFKIHHVRTSGNQTHAIVKHKGTGEHFQVDFEPVDYDQHTQEPTQFERFAHNSHINDIEKGIKGFAHKEFINSILDAHSTPAIISKTKGRGKNKIETEEEGDVKPHSFSDKGIRSKWQTVGERDGKPIVKEMPSKGAEYSNDLHDIYHKMFGRHPSEQDIQDMHSFSGLVDHVKKHIPQEKHARVFSSFVDKLWHPTARTRSTDADVDRKAKESVYSELEKHFPAEAAAQKEQTEQKKKAYYSDTKKFGIGDEPSEEHHGITESIEDKHIAIAAGRFTGPTSEHQKLLDNLFSQKADKHQVYVMGPETKEKTTEKDPLTQEEKIEQLKKLYPDHEDSFVPQKNPMKALVHAYHNNKEPGKKVHLKIVAGTGDSGIDKKSNVGGSLDSYMGLLDKYNKTQFPSGDVRFNFDSVTPTENPRGNISGSVIRKFAREHDHTNPEHVQQFKSLLHSGFSTEDAQHLMKTIKERSSIKESLLQKIKNLL